LWVSAGVIGFYLIWRILYFFFWRILYFFFRGSITVPRKEVIGSHMGCGWQASIPQKSHKNSA